MRTGVIVVVQSFKKQKLVLVVEQTESGWENLELFVKAVERIKLNPKFCEADRDDYAPVDTGRNSTKYVFIVNLNVHMSNFFIQHINVPPH